jgi:hypothetical protein
VGASGNLAIGQSSRRLRGREALRELRGGGACASLSCCSGARKKERKMGFSEGTPLGLPARGLRPYEPCCLCDALNGKRWEGTQTRESYADRDPAPSCHSERSEESRLSTMRFVSYGAEAGKPRLRLDLVEVREAGGDCGRGTLTLALCRFATRQATLSARGPESVVSAKSGLEGARCVV